jgi:hypothetical protein
MVDPKNAGKLLSFPLSTPVPEGAAQNWDPRILETRDNLVNGLDHLRHECNAMLAGKATTAADEVLARVETFLRNDRVSCYKLVAKISIHGPTQRSKTKGFAALSRCESATVKASNGSTLLPSR